MKYPPVQYHDYLQLDQILGSQTLKSVEFGKPAHEEHLFIVVHQAYELWFKQILFDIDSVLEIFAKAQVPEESMGLIVARLERIVHIQRLINGQIDVLETMTPLEFLEFRDFLYPASGFQSFQWRLIETKIGLVMDKRVKFDESPFYRFLKPDQAKVIQNTLNQKSLFQYLQSWLERTPFCQPENFDFWPQYLDAMKKIFDGDEAIIASHPSLGAEQKEKSLAQLKMARQQLSSFQTETSFEKLRQEGHFRLSFPAFRAALFIQLYRERPALQLPHRLIQVLMDWEEKLTEWRNRHAIMAYRMLGRKIGTGGSSGHDYLKQTADQHRVFGDFFQLSTFYLAASARPTLPPEILRMTEFGWKTNEQKE